MCVDFCKLYNGETVRLDYNPKEAISEFDELGMFLHKWARNYLIGETLEIGAFYFWTALHFTVVRVLSCFSHRKNVDSGISKSSRVTPVFIGKSK